MRAIEASSNGQGGYEFANLSVGEYTLEVSAERFNTVIKVETIQEGETLFESITLEAAETPE